MLSVRPSIKSAIFLTCLATLASFYFDNTPLPLFLTRFKDVLTTGLILLSAGGWGRPFLLSTALRPTERVAFSTAIGLGALSVLMILAGTMHLWFPIIGWILIAGGLSLSRRFGRDLKESCQEWTAREAASIAPFILSIGILLGFVLAFAPITYYDSLVYHLALPSAYIQAHHWVGLPGLVYSAFPQTIEMLWTLALLIGSDTVVNLLGWSLGILLLIAVIQFARRFLDRDTGWIAAALLAVMPAFLLLGSGGYIDVGLTLFGFMALYAVCLWVSEGQSRFAWAGGLLAGWTVGCKYTGGLIVVLLAVVMIWRIHRSRGALRWNGFFLYTGAAILVFAPWMIKNTLFVGNPVFPFLHPYGIRSLNPWVSDAAAGYFAGITEYYSRSWTQLPGLIWDMAVNGIAFGRGIDVLGDYGWIPFLGLIPALWLCRERPRMVTFLLMFSGVFLLCWAFSRPVFRFLLPISPLWALLAGYAWVHGIRRMPKPARVITGGILGTFLLSGLFLFFYTLSVPSPWAAAIGMESKTLYLARRLNYYPAAVYVNTQLSNNSQIYVLGDQRGYYYERKVRITPVFSKNPFTEWANTAKNAEELKTILQREGITHVVFNRTEWNRLNRSYPTLRFSTVGEKNWADFQAHGLNRLYRDNACDVYELRQ